MSNEESIKKAELMLIGVQLICENAEDVMDSDIASQTMKYKLKNLLNRCNEFEKLFWSNLDNQQAELEFQAKVRKIEEL